MKVTKVNIRGHDLTRLVNELRSSYGRDYKFINENTSVFIFEEFYFRISSYLSTTIIVNFISEQACCIEIISSGGGNGMIGLTWGAEGKSTKEIIKLVKNICQDNSWSYDVG